MCCRNCSETITQCPGCKIDSPRRTDIVPHFIQQQLNDLTIQCSKCSEETCRGNWEDHLLDCIEECPNLCGKALRTGLTTQHIREECPHTYIECIMSSFGCGWKGHRTHLAQHLDTCSRHQLRSLLETHQKEREQFEKERGRFKRQKERMKKEREAIAWERVEMLNNESDWKLRCTELEDELGKTRQQLTDWQGMYEKLRDLHDRTTFDQATTHRHI
ncbi:hypothetical protein PROFUN_04824 [Planoprotostelium fungivorum]|uniref:TRAF-type domain-containing protein n=1 Tax=Planoprotostelium fungivorum TaxID=1890364 RepID=A0A2P6NT87_9EUKA|nr:hypothetical protein PROFUN_04824 [Planoprotostelium fungivorum]